MASLFDKARDWLPAQMNKAVGKSITYARGLTTASLTVRPGRVAMLSQSDGNSAPARVELSERDYTISVADIDAAGFFPPQVGDRITETIDGDAITFQLERPDNGERAWRFADIQRTDVRLHCKRVKVIPDTTVPTLVSARVQTSGNTLRLRFSESVTDVGAFAGFSISGTFGNASAVYLSGDGTDAVMLTLSRTIGSNETITLDYAPGTVADLSSNALAAINDQAVTNSSAATGEWNPDGVSAVKFWPTAGPTYNFTDDAGTIHAAAGDTVANATDRAGNFTILQSTAGDRPTLRLTGSDYDLRNITNDFLECTGVALDAATAFSMFAAATADSLPGNLKTLWGWGSGGELGIIRSTAGGNLEAVCWIGGGSRTITTLNPIPVGSRFVVGLVVDTALSSDQMKLYLNGTLIGSLTQSGALDPAQSTVRRLLTDAFDSARGWPGGIYEAVVLNRAPIDATELAAITAYLAG